MKKINLVLCAAAIACTAFFTSCDNGAKTYTDVTYEDYKNTYDLVSFTKVVTTSETETNAAGTAVTHDDTTATYVWTADAKSAKNTVAISWRDSEVVDGFISYTINIATDDLNPIDGKEKHKTGNGDFSAEADYTSEEAGVTNSIGRASWTLYKQNDKYYIKSNGNLCEVTGDPEKDTTISYTDVSVSDLAGWKDSDAKNKDIRTTTTTYTIVLKASESL